MNVLHLRTGDALPPPQPALLRLYSMKFCPFSQTTRLVLAHKGIPHEVVNIHLQQKPEWFAAEKSPLGKVPCLELDGKLVFDSTICNRYLDAAYPQKPLLSAEPYLRAVTEMLVERYVGTVRGFVSHLVWTGADDEKLADAQKGLEHFEKLLLDGRAFFGGGDLDLLDVSMWPMLEKVEYIDKLRSVDVLPEERFPMLRAWRRNMQMHPATGVVSGGGGTDMENLAKLKLDAEGHYIYDIGVVPAN